MAALLVAGSNDRSTCISIAFARRILDLQLRLYFLLLIEVCLFAVWGDLLQGGGWVFRVLACLHLSVRASTKITLWEVEFEVVASTQLSIFRGGPIPLRRNYFISFFCFIFSKKNENTYMDALWWLLDNNSAKSNPNCEHIYRLVITTTAAFVWLCIENCHCNSAFVLA
jgi:hypothetical protein